QDGAHDRDSCRAPRCLRRRAQLPRGLGCRETPGREEAAVISGITGVPRRRPRGLGQEHGVAARPVVLPRPTAPPPPQGWGWPRRRRGGGGGRRGRGPGGGGGGGGGARGGGGGGGGGAPARGGPRRAAPAFSPGGGRPGGPRRPPRPPAPAAAGARASPVPALGSVAGPTQGSPCWC